MKTINADFDQDGYVRNYALIGTIVGGEEVNIEDDIPDEELFDKLPYYKKKSGRSNVLEYDANKYEEKHRTDVSAANTAKYVPNVMKSMQAAVKAMMPTVELDQETKMQVSGLYDTWKSEILCEVGYITNADGQTWECYAKLDPSLNPGVTPYTPAWHNFFKALHGKSPKTARPFTPVHAEYDMYRAGEYMVWTDDYVYECLQDTNFNPEEYAAAWKKHDRYSAQ